MFAFKKNNKQNNEYSEITTKIDQDLLVRNMPNSSKLSKTNLSTFQNNSQVKDNLLSTIVKPEKNHQLVGMLIISGGIILVGALIYLSYVFIIKPQLKPEIVPIKKVEIEPVSLINFQPATTSEEAIILNPIGVSTVTPTVIDFVSTSSPEEKMPEESTGRTEADLEPILDMDSDGLNNEEELILGTSLEFQDSNSNSYPDLVEINNNYNPSGAGRLNSNSGLKKYSNEKFSYSLLFPKNWETNVLNDESVLIFNAPDDSIIQISVQENSGKQSILNWYSELFPQAPLTYDRLITKDTWSGIFGSDFQNFYLTEKSKNNIYTISYIPAVSGRIVYPNIFKLMINSLSIE